MEYGVERIYHPHGGMELGLEAMIADLVERTAAARRETAVPEDVNLDATVDIAATMSAVYSFSTLANMQSTAASEMGTPAPVSVPRNDSIISIATSFGGGGDEQPTATTAVRTAKRAMVRRELLTRL